MNKKLLIVFLLLLGLFLMPNVYAEELPREGVTYFMTYPNNEEVVTEDYDEAVSEPERLIYEGTTDSNGQIKITGLGNQGEIKIVENGNTTKVNLSNQRSAEVQHKALLNPKTGGSLLFIVVLVGGLVVITIKTKKKKVLLVVPVLLAVTLLSNVKAESEDFVVTIKNELGQTISGTQVKVYAKPISVEGIPAIKLSSNGGHFFDGTTIMYAKIPRNGCSTDEFFDYFYEQDEQKQDYFKDNSQLAYREGYYPAAPELSDTLTNGQTINVLWEEDSDAILYEDDLNGGYLDFYGKKINKLYLYYGSVYPGNIKNDNKYLIGWDFSSNCSSYNENGVRKNDASYPEEEQKTWYACWNEKPDGIYVNDKTVFVFNPNSCNNDEYFGSNFELYSYDNEYNRGISFWNDDSDNINFLFEEWEKLPVLGPEPCRNCEVTLAEFSNAMANHSFGNQSDSPSIVAAVPAESYCAVTTAINKIEIIRNGQQVLSLTSSDLSSNMCGSYPSYTVSNEAKREILANYIHEHINTCYKAPQLVDEYPAQ